MMAQPVTQQIEHIFTAWDDALGAKDVDAQLRFTSRTTLESPLITYLLGTDRVWFVAEKTCGASCPRYSPTSRHAAALPRGFLTDGSRVVWSTASHRR